jgi:hypothetical protein
MKKAFGEYFEVIWNKISKEDYLQKQNLIIFLSKFNIQMDPDFDEGKMFFLSNFQNSKCFLMLIQMEKSTKMSLKIF